MIIASKTGSIRDIFEQSRICWHGDDESETKVSRDQGSVTQHVLSVEYLSFLLHSIKT